MLRRFLPLFFFPLCFFISDSFLLPSVTRLAVGAAGALSRKPFLRWATGCGIYFSLK